MPFPLDRDNISAPYVPIWMTGGNLGSENVFLLLPADAVDGLGLDPFPEWVGASEGEETVLDRSCIVTMGALDLV